MINYWKWSQTTTIKLSDIEPVDDEPVNDEPMTMLDGEEANPWGKKDKKKKKENKINKSILDNKI